MIIEIYTHTRIALHADRTEQRATLATLHRGHQQRLGDWSTAALVSLCPCHTWRRTQHIATHGTHSRAIHWIHEEQKFNRIVAICYQTLNMFYFTLAHERFVMIWCTRRISPFRHFMRACGLTLHLIAHVGALILGVCTDQPQQRRRVLARSWDHSPTPKNSEMDRNNEQNFEILWPKMTKMVCVSKSLSRPQIGLRTMNNQPRVRGRAVKTSEATNHHQASKSDPMPTSSLSVCSIDPVSSWPSRISC